MIKNISGSKYIMVSNSGSSDPYISPGSVGAGMLRWNPNMNCMEVNDGNMWKQFSMKSFPWQENLKKKEKSSSIRAVNPHMFNRRLGLTVPEGLMML